MKRKETLLLVLEVAEKSLTPVQLQKSLFLIGRLMEESVEQDYYKFEPYHYGPFSRSIYDDVEQEFLKGNVIINNIQGQKWPTYSISDKGKVFIKENIPKDEKKRKNIKKIVTWVQGLSFEKLVMSIYKHFPDYKRNSIFFG